MIILKGQVLPTTGLEELEIIPVGRLLEAIIAALPSGDRSEVGKEINREINPQEIEQVARIL